MMRSVKQCDARGAMRGFTLVEVMVALAIFAVAAIALTRAGMSYSQSVSSLTDRTLAHFVAMNEASTLRITQAWPEGSAEKDVEEQGQNWKIVEQVYPTPADNVRRIEIRVYRANETGSDNSTNSSANSNANSSQKSTSPDSATAGPAPLTRLVIFLRQETRV